MPGVSLRALAVLAALAVPTAMLAQLPPAALPPPLFVRFAGPPGTTVTIYRGGPGQTFVMPCLAAFRPGYRYRIQLGGIPDALQPRAMIPPVGSLPVAATVCPTLDVLGSLRLARSMCPADHPATIYFTEEDFATVRDGSVVTKVVVLERPETAVPLATKCDRPLEITVPPNRDPLLEAEGRGRPLLILQMGERQTTPEELTCQAIPGTVLLQGEQVLPPPSVPPCLPWKCYPLVDPSAGLPSPESEICFHDGGDEGAPATNGPGGKLYGLDPSDTVAQYIDSCGNPKIAVSNKVCMCVPRYLLIRNAISPAANSIFTAPGNTRIARAPAKAELELGPRENNQETSLDYVAMRLKASGLINLQEVQIVGNSEGLIVYANAEGTGSVTGKCAEVCPLDCGKLIIIKWPDKCDPEIGDLVTLYIRYKNEGSRPISGVVVSDSLTARLEYVPNSGRTDRDALFTTKPNEVDSVALRWEITGQLQPGQTGTVCFQARVR